VLALVALRLALGCQFLYEGLWKVKRSDFRHDARWKSEKQLGDEFTAAPFLTSAKGPVAAYFYAMVPDIDARQRLHVEAVEKHGKKTNVIHSGGIADRWKRVEQEFVEYYKPAKLSDAKAASAYAKFSKDAEDICTESCKQLDKYLTENADDIAAYFGSLDRFQNDPEHDQTAPYQKQRRWDRMTLLRGEAGKWIKEIEGQERAYAQSLYGLLHKDQLDQEREDRGLVTSSWSPFQWDRMKQIDFAVTFALTAIGLCLMLGLCTPLAALGGACFMCFVVLTQPAFPTIYPHDPPVVGHSLLINKDFIEMLALLVIAATRAGRWGGFEVFVNRWILRPLFSRKSPKTK
jgi:uncharacterized membrane protein YphA (DoxX/SURF4 family)